jgi:hypothetical protein
MNIVNIKITTYKNRSNTTKNDNSLRGIVGIFYKKVKIKGCPSIRKGKNLSPVELRSL